MLVLETGTLTLSFIVSRWPVRISENRKVSKVVSERLAEKYVYNR